MTKFSRSSKTQIYDLIACYSIERFIFSKNTEKGYKKSRISVYTSARQGYFSNPLNEKFNLQF